jgi:RNA polymerase sigma factor (sigma-70 family)
VSVSGTTEDIWDAGSPTEALPEITRLDQAAGRYAGAEDGSIPSRAWAAGGAGRDFAEVWKRHARTIYRYCLRWTSGRRDCAEEAFSRAAIIAFHKFSTLRGGAESELGWLARLAHNVCIDLHREHRRLREQSLEQTEESIGDGALASVSDDTEGPEERLIRDELAAQLHRLIAGLPPRLREILLLHLEHDMGYREIAEALSLTDVTVRKRMQEARHALRRRFAELATRSGPEAEHSTAVRRGIGASVADRCTRSEEGAPCRLRAVPLVLSGGVERDLWLPVPFPARPASERRLAAVDAYVCRHPAGVKKRLELARLLLVGGRTDEALAHYSAVAQRRPHLLAAWNEPGEVLRALGRNEEANELCRQAVRVVRGRGARSVLCAMLAAGEGRQAAAAETLLEATAEYPQDATAAVALGRLWLSADRPTEALGAFAAALACDPNDPSALAFGHEALLLADCPRTASLRAVRASELDPDCWLALSHQLELRCRYGQVNDAPGRVTRQLLQRLSRIAPDRPETHLAKAWYDQARGKWKAAEAGLLSFLARHPRHATGWFYRGLMLGALGDFAAATSAFKHARALEPGRREVEVELCYALVHAGSAVAARVLAEEMLCHFPESWSVAAAVSWSALRTGDEALAIGQSQRAVSLQPRLSAAWLAHSELLLETGLVPEAIAAAGIARDLVPQDEGSAAPARAALLLARCHAQAGEPR